MRLNKLLSVLSFMLVSSLAFNAQADTAVSCNWTYLGGGGAYGSWTSVDGCFIPNAQMGPIAQRTRTNTGSCSISVNSPYVNKGTCASPSIYITTATSSSASSTPVIPPQPVCTTTSINIGQSCSGENWCMESFGRACTSAGGNIVWSSGTYVCNKTTCTNP